MINHRSGGSRQEAAARSGGQWRVSGSIKWHICHRNVYIRCQTSPTWTLTAACHGQ